MSLFMLRHIHVYDDDDVEVVFRVNNGDPSGADFSVRVPAGNRALDAAVIEACENLMRQLDHWRQDLEQIREAHKR
jgi:hypothetical protein